MNDVDRAVGSLRAGGLVVLPTETVYGLAADAGNPRAVARIYAVKGRPADHPLILHLAAGAGLSRWAADVPDYAAALAARLWPGPMTLVLPKSASVGLWVTGGQDTVAVRVPDHPVALQILSRFAGAVAAPSANVFGRVSPTSARHAAADLGDRLDPDRDVVVDGGDCRVGVESTIIDCTGGQPRVLRPGFVGAEQIAAVAGMPLAAAATASVRVPGTLQSHYAPKAAVRVLAEPLEPGEPTAGPPTCGLLAPADVPTPRGVVRLAAPADPVAYARVLYQALREADSLMLAQVVAIPPSGSAPAAIAVRDRLRRAAADAGPAQP